MLRLALLILLAVDPAQVTNLLRSGLLDLEHGQLAQARSELEQASKLDPSNALVWTSLVRAYSRLNQPALAQAAAAKAEQTGAGNPVVAHALAIYYSGGGQFAHAAALEAEYAQSPSADSGAAERVADLYLDAGDAHAALPFAQKAWSAAKNDPQTAFDYAQALLKTQDFTRAAEVLENAVESNPNNAQLTLALGVARYGQRRFPDAITAFLKTIAIDPRIPQPYVFLGRMLDQAGATMPAIVADYRRWMTMEPKGAEPPLLLAEALVASNSASDEAEPLLRRSIGLDPRNWEAHYQLGLLLSNKHAYREAAAELEASTKLNPNEPMPHYHLARVYDRLGESDRANAEREIHKRLMAAATHAAAAPPNQ
ncbi:MAG: tetratricopeptide repeat protein [Bryobacteraceae bacterium]